MSDQKNSGESTNMSNQKNTVVNTNIPVATNSVATNIDNTSTTTQETNAIPLESTTNLMIKYFVPPVTTMYMQWGETAMVLLFFILMFIGIAYWYIYANYSDYQNRIAVISNAYLFGKNPQIEFENYIKNAQANTLGAAVNNIQSATSEVVEESSRLNMTAQRLANTVATDLPQNASETSNLGISILSNIAKLRDTISKLGGSFVLGNYISDGAISTVKPPSQTPDSNKSPSPS